jgi:hypothetical protein
VLHEDLCVGLQQRGDDARSLVEQLLLLQVLVVHQLPLLLVAVFGALLEDSLALALGALSQKHFDHLDCLRHLQPSGCMLQHSG